MNNAVVGIVITAALGMAGTILAFWIRRIEGKDKVFRESVRNDMRLVYALKEDYSNLHTWAIDVRALWHDQQRELRAAGVVSHQRELPPIPEPQWRRIEREEEEKAAKHG